MRQLRKGPFQGVCILFATLCVGSMLASAPPAQQPTGADPGAKGKPAPASIADFTLQDARGKTHTRKDWGRHKAVVLFFLSTECPLSQFYSPLMEEKAKAYAGRGIALYGVHCDPDLKAEDVAKHAAEYRLTFPILMDPTQLLARQAGVEVVPEAVVLSPLGQVLYHGRIDDRYSLDGKRRDEPRVKDLANAVEAVLAGKAPAVQQTKAFGCPLPTPAPAASPTPGKGRNGAPEGTRRDPE
jgi:peroxiredoxin